MSLIFILQYCGITGSVLENFPFLSAVTFLIFHSQYMLIKIGENLSFFHQHQSYLLHESSFDQIHTDGDIVPSFGCSTGSLQPVLSSACPLQSFGYSSKGSKLYLRRTFFNLEVGRGLENAFIRT